VRKGKLEEKESRSQRISSISQLAVDVDQKLTLQDIVPTNKRAVMMLCLTTWRHVNIELTVSREERCDKAHERKRSKYENGPGNII
jgi:hypothetical protein